MNHLKRFNESNSSTDEKKVLDCLSDIIDDYESTRIGEKDFYDRCKTYMSYCVTDNSYSFLARRGKIDSYVTVQIIVNSDKVPEDFKISKLKEEVDIAVERLRNEFDSVESAYRMKDEFHIFKISCMS